jgi:hypothetical protein
VAALAAGALIGLALSGLGTSRAVQNPTIAFDVVTSGNTYSDPGSGGDNSMTVGAVDNCLTTAAPGNNNSHSHIIHVVIKNVEDMIGWQARVNYRGNEWRPSTVNFSPFTDTNTLQGISFVNLPIDQATFVHRAFTSASSIPASQPGPQTAAFGSSYLGTQNFAVSPDTPAKAVPDDSSYSAPNGGVVAAVATSVLALNAGSPSLFLNMDDGSPNSPGSGISFFDGTTSQQILLPQSALGDAFHGEGTTCVPLNCTTQECPGVGSVENFTFTNNTGQTASDLHVTFSGPMQAQVVQNPAGCPTPTVIAPVGSSTVDVDWGVACADNGESAILKITSEPPVSPVSSYWTISGSPIPSGSPSPAPTQSPTPTPAGHDARLTRIGGVPKSVRLSPGEVIADSGSITVANQSSHTDTIGVYVDVSAPASGGCTPNGRVLQTTVTLAAGAKTTIPVPVDYSCSDTAAANGLSFTWTAVADHGADDLGSCPPGSLQGVTCFNALANDDEDPADNRLSRNGPKVIAQ